MSPGVIHAHAPVTADCRMPLFGIRRRQFPREEHTASVGNVQTRVCLGEGDDRLARAGVAAVLW
jgi:hypothetical protein